MAGLWLGRLAGDMHSLRRLARGRADRAVLTALSSCSRPRCHIPGGRGMQAQFTIGAEASCADGPCGDVSRVVVDPVARAVTHLVVEPKHRHGLGRLVPLDLVDGGAGEIPVPLTPAEVKKARLRGETQ